MDSKPQKCERCAAEATVHEVMIKGGKKQERHLCERCARDLGVAPAGTATPLTQLITQIITSQPAVVSEAGTSGGPGQAESVKSSSATHCGRCGLSYSQFRATGLLGCPECYRAFEALLAPLLARAHEGGTHHVGRRPDRFRSAADDSGATVDSKPDPAAVAERSRRDRTAALRRQLAEAVATEQYERAARIRDELHRCEMPTGDSTETGAPVSRPPGGVGGAP